MIDTDDAERHFKRIEALAQNHRLAEVRRGTEDGIPALLVENRAFVQLSDDNTLVVHCPQDQKLLLMDISPAIYFQTDEHEGQSTMLVRLDAISDEELGLRIEDAWHFRAPEHLKGKKS